MSKLHLQRYVYLMLHQYVLNAKPKCKNYPKQKPSQKKLTVSQLFKIYYIHTATLFLVVFVLFFLELLYKHQEQQKGQGTKQQSQREGESETVTKGGSRKGTPLNEGEGAVRKVERGTITGTSLRLSSGFKSFRSSSTFLL